MKVVILAGGLGTRLAEETDEKPKPMVEIGGKPILWHIMRLYSHYGLKEFIICLGYKGHVVREYFANYMMHNSNVFIDLKTSHIEFQSSSTEDWHISLIDTGVHSETGGRLRRISEFLDGDTFCMTYGDGLADLDIGDLIAFHKEHGKEATLTAVRPPGRFGALEIHGNDVQQFIEKPGGDGGWINGGFFVLQPSVIERIAGDDTKWELAPLTGLAADNQLAAYMHDGFWMPMDTLRDKRRLEQLWHDGKADWKR